MSNQVWQRPFGAVPLSTGGVEFRVWAPSASRVAVRVHGGERELEPAGEGVFAAEIAAEPGDDYFFVLDGGRALPDPCSRHQPDGIRGPSRIVDTSRFEIADGPRLRLAELVLYELHVGTFTLGGTFDAAIPHLRRLRELGVTAVELMPVSAFPGERGWGYDGVYAYAPHAAYGGPGGLARFVDAAHREGLGVVLDVVYNHIGPGGDAIGAFGPYFTAAHHTFWGDAIDYSRRGVREWAIGNAEYWTRDFSIDGLRLDAVHAIYDDSPVHVLEELRERVDGLVTSEMGPDDFRPLEEWGHDAMWLDNLHHELHVLLTGEREGYYEPYGSLAGLVRELTRPEPERLIVCAQNHDQVGNRAVGDRLPPEAHRVALAIVLFSLNTPLLFMGEEHDEPAPFQFFTDHIDPAIADATREGRKREFAAFTSFSGKEVPDPQAYETFARSRISQPDADPFYAELIRLRRELPRTLDVSTEGRVLTLRRGGAMLVADFDAKTVELSR
ncbi:MAG: Malto-oligosyltrehalose trehalohydrolase [Actinomycetia bacterium]|jgi:maltooligosyltrehalose trehalohydrolase|nr:Malto-oligosyltrehalose trehalohydrolase [Actinomycetes bacterium]